ncbi:hypothetical protein WAI453_000672 [Rhynchosporium graminicola]
MKFRRWIGQAVSALRDEKGKEKKDGHRISDVRSRDDPKDVERSPEPLQLRAATKCTSESWKSEVDMSAFRTLRGVKGTPIEIVENELEDDDEWTISGSASSETLPMRNDSQASTSSASTTTLSTITEPADEGDIDQYEDSNHDSDTTPKSSSPTYTSTPLQNGRKVMFKEDARPLLRPRTKSTSTTIFKHSSLTIILTTPDSDAALVDLTSSPQRGSHQYQYKSHYSLPTSPPLTPRPSLNHSSSSAILSTRSLSAPSLPSLPPASHYFPRDTSLPTLPSHNTRGKYNTQDISRLMPPSEEALDILRLRKAQEHHEIRKYMISFLNTKGASFPEKLRVKIMQGYGIEEAELGIRNEWGMKEKHNRDGRINEMKGRAEEKKEHLAVLAKAFRSQIPLVAPPLEPTYLKPTNHQYPHTKNTRTANHERELRRVSRTISASDTLLPQLKPISSSTHPSVTSLSPQPDRASLRGRNRHKPETFSTLLRESTSVPAASRSRFGLPNNSSSAASIRTTRSTTASLFSRANRLSEVGEGNQKYTQRKREDSFMPIKVPMESQNIVAEEGRMKRGGVFGAVRGVLGSGSSSSLKGGMGG